MNKILHRFVLINKTDEVTNRVSQHRKAQDLTNSQPNSSTFLYFMEEEGKEPITTGRHNNREAQQQAEHIKRVSCLHRGHANLCIIKLYICVVKVNTNPTKPLFFRCILFIMFKYTGGKYPEYQKKVSDFLELKLQEVTCLTWVLRIQLQSSSTAACALNH